MTFTIVISTPGATQAVTSVNAITTSLTATTQAANRASGAMGQLTAGANSAAGSIGNLVHMIEAYFAIHKFEQIVDSYVEVRNRINSVAKDQDNLNGLMNETFEIAQRTRSQWDTLASTYQRLSNASHTLGLSQKQVLDLTETLAMGMKLSGSSTREAQMTMMELTHAFTVGTLTGREFRVMMKDAPALMHELQIASGKTGAEFAEMGKHSKFTAQQFVEWFGKAREAIEDKFGKTIPTIAEDLLILSNAAKKFFGEAAVGSGVMTALATAARYVAEHFEGVAKVVLGVGEALIGLFVIEKIIGLVRALTVAVAANPIGALLVAITVGISLLRQFGDEINTTQKIWSNVDNQFVTVGDHLRALWQMIKQLGEAMANLVDEGWHKMLDAFSTGVDSGGIELSLRNVLLLIAAFVDAAIGIFKFLDHTITTILGGIPLSIAEFFVDAIKGITRIVQDAVNAVLDAVNKLIEAKNWINEKLTGEKTPVNNSRYNAIAWANETNKRFGLGDYAPADPEQLQKNMNAAIAAGIRLSDIDYGPGGEGDRNQYVRYSSPRATATWAPGGRTTNEANNLLKHVDLTFKNPYDDAARTMIDKFGEDWKNDIKETNVTKDMVSSFMDRLDRAARDEAAKRVMAQKAGSSVGTDKSAKEATPPDEKLIARLQKQLEAMLEKTNPLIRAQEELVRAQQTFDQAVQHNIKTLDGQVFTQERAAKAMADLRIKLQDALQPYEAWTRKQHEADAELKSTTEATIAATEAQKFLNEMKAKGLTPGGEGSTKLTQEQIDAAARLNEEMRRHAEIMHAEQAITSAIIDPQKQYLIGIRAAGDLLHDGAISAEQYNRAVDNARAAYLAAMPGARNLAQLTEAAWLEAKRGAEAAGVAVEAYSVIADRERAKQLAVGPEGKTLGGGLEAVWLKAKSDAESFGATVAGMVVSDVDKLNEALVAMANDGAVSWSQMVDAMIQDLERLALKQLEIAAINAIITAATGGVPVPGAGQAAALVPGVNAPITDPSQVSRLAPTAYAAAPAASTAAPASPVIVQVHNHYDKSVSIAANASAQGQSSILNVLRANQGTVRKFAGR